MNIRAFSTLRRLNMAQVDYFLKLKGIDTPQRLPRSPFHVPNKR